MREGGINYGFGGEGKVLWASKVEEGTSMFLFIDIIAVALL